MDAPKRIQRKRPPKSEALLILWRIKNRIAEAYFDGERHTWQTQDDRDAFAAVNKVMRDYDSLAGELTDAD